MNDHFRKQLQKSVRSSDEQLDALENELITEVDASKVALYYATANVERNEQKQLGTRKEVEAAKTLKEKVVSAIGMVNTTIVAAEHSLTSTTQAIGNMNTAAINMKSASEAITTVSSESAGVYAVARSLNAGSDICNEAQQAFVQANEASDKAANVGFEALNAVVTASQSAAADVVKDAKVSLNTLNKFNEIAGENLVAESEKDLAVTEAAIAANNDRNKLLEEYQVASQRLDAVNQTRKKVNEVTNHDLKLYDSGLRSVAKGFKPGHSFTVEFNGFSEGENKTEYWLLMVPLDEASAFDITQAADSKGKGDAQKFPSSEESKYTITCTQKGDDASTQFWKDYLGRDISLGKPYVAFVYQINAESSKVNFLTLPSDPLTLRKVLPQASTKSPELQIINPSWNEGMQVIVGAEGDENSDFEYRVVFVSSNNLTVQNWSHFDPKRAKQLFDKHLQDAKNYINWLVSITLNQKIGLFVDLVKGKAIELGRLRGRYDTVKQILDSNQIQSFIALNDYLNECGYSLSTSRLDLIYFKFIHDKLYTHDNKMYFSFPKSLDYLKYLRKANDNVAENQLIGCLRYKRGLAKERITDVSEEWSNNASNRRDGQPEVKNNKPLFPFDPDIIKTLSPSEYQSVAIKRDTLVENPLPLLEKKLEEARKILGKDQSNQEPMRKLGVEFMLEARKLVFWVIFYSPFKKSEGTWWGTTINSNMLDNYGNPLQINSFDTDLERMLNRLFINALNGLTTPDKWTPESIIVQPIIDHLNEHPPRARYHVLIWTTLKRNGTAKPEEYLDNFSDYSIQKVALYA